ncbi:uncharacterized protein [Magallana gigas]|uniref:uncharacterized protein isoform X1 n=1 Tax=Magallana gigas TaxID=29159 RepID=UPI003341F1CE
MSRLTKDQVNYPPEEVDPFVMLYNIQHQIGHAVEDAAGDVTAKNKLKSGSLFSTFETGNQIMLVSRTSGRALRILRTKADKLKVDGRGTVTRQEWNAVWTVFNEGHNQVRLHNHNNFLAIVNGEATVITVPEGSEHNILETKLQLVLDPESFVALESIQEPEKCVGVEDNGSMKAAENCTSSDNHAMFGIHLIVRLRHICCYFIFA